MRLLKMLGIIAAITLSWRASEAKTITHADLITSTLYNHNIDINSDVAHTPASWFVVSTDAFRRYPAVGSYVRVGGAPPINCFNQYSTGDNPGNPWWWFNKKMKVVSVYTDCDGVANGSMTIQAELPGNPYNGYTATWPSDLYSPW